jgi:LmbE family N-acetylglucosaminyl deacetylase
VIELGLRRPLRRLLVVGSHPDDIEIGCGGTILSLLRGQPGVDVRWVVLTGDDDARAAEARSSAEAFLSGAGETRIDVHGFRDGFLPAAWGEVKETFESLKDSDPDLVLTHTRDDLHQDHRLVCELTWNTFRHHLVLEYEVPKYDGDLGRPNLFLPLAPDLVDEKLELLRSGFASQRGKHWFDDEVFRGLMRLRGMEAGSTYAEAFTCRKLRLAA